MNELHLFAGAGGGILAGQLLGHRTVCAVEWEPYAQAVLVARQNDGTFPPFPIWDDVQSFDGRPWRGVVDVVCGGFPCQDISVAGSGAGLDGERSGMWHHMARIIGEVRPRFAFIENSPALLTRGLDRVLCDLAALGFDARWGVVSAADCGAPHRRERIWIMANASGRRCSQSGQGEVEQPGRTEVIGSSDAMANANGVREQQRAESRDGARDGFIDRSKDLADSDSDSLQRMVAQPQQGGHGRPARLLSGTRELPDWPDDPADAPEPGLGRVVNGMANRSHRLKAIGNGQVSRVAAAAFTTLSRTPITPE